MFFFKIRRNSFKKKKKKEEGGKKKKKLFLAFLKISKLFCPVSGTELEWRGIKHSTFA